MFFYTSLADISNFANIDEPVTFCPMNLFLNDVDIQLILEFNNSFGKYHPLNPENSLKVFFLGHSGIQKQNLICFTKNI